VAFATLIIW